MLYEKVLDKKTELMYNRFMTKEQNEAVMKLVHQIIANGDEKFDVRIDKDGYEVNIYNEDGSIISHLKGTCNTFVDDEVGLCIHSKYCTRIIKN